MSSAVNKCTLLIGIGGEKSNLPLSERNVHRGLGIQENWGVGVVCI